MPAEVVSIHPAARKIALVGSAPSSAHLAPYGDPSWTIWACSPAAVPHVRRVDAWFELHPFDDPTMTPDYVAFMAQLDKPVYLIEPHVQITQGILYPRDLAEREFGQHFFTSSLSWMFALALMQSPQEIGLWGVDMSADTEYGLQRPGCHFFAWVASQRGVKVTVPPQSDLMRPPAPYGYVQTSLMYRKLEARKSELDKRIAEAAAQYEHHRNEWHFLRGARDDLDYMLNTWMQ
jgi:hypothetical protein